jgi:predicted amidophosphoribosyltransferase
MNALEPVPQIGPCCACGKDDDTVKNIIGLNRKGPDPGKGWGCIVCGLPFDGAQAPLCDQCLKSGDKIQFKFVAAGYLTEGKRIPIDELPDTYHNHRFEHHPEAWTWFDTSPDPGPDCICSVCEAPIDQSEIVPIRIFDDETNLEARFHYRCWVGEERPEVVI